MPDPRLEIDGKLVCPRCGGCPYKVWRRQNVNFPGTEREQFLQTYEHIVWPTSFDIPPPDKPWKICCPDCGEELKRVAP